MYLKLLEEKIHFVTRGSGWSLKFMHGIQLRTNKVNSLAGSTYVKFPKIISNRKAVINVKNNDNLCFKYAILTKYNTNLDKSRFNKNNFKQLEKSSRPDFGCVSFPTLINQIKKFERINNVSVNVYGLGRPHTKRAELLKAV